LKKKRVAMTADDMRRVCERIRGAKGAKEKARRTRSAAERLAASLALLTPEEQEKVAKSFHDANCGEVLNLQRTSDRGWWIMARLPATE
jgi:hypothetical protein